MPVTALTSASERRRLKRIARRQSPRLGIFVAAGEAGTAATLRTAAGGVTARFLEVFGFIGHSVKGEAVRLPERVSPRRNSLRVRDRLGG